MFSSQASCRLSPACVGDSEYACCYTYLMLMRARNLVVTLLVLMLPWQSFAALAISSASHHHDANEIGRLANAGGTQHAHEHHEGDQPRDNAGASSDHDDGSAAASAACTNV